MTLEEQKRIAKLYHSTFYLPNDFNQYINGYRNGYWIYYDDNIPTKVKLYIANFNNDNIVGKICVFDGGNYEKAYYHI